MQQYKERAYTVLNSVLIWTTFINRGLRDLDTSKNINLLFFLYVY